MTKDEVMALTNKELFIKAAKIVGWRRLTAGEAAGLLPLKEEDQTLVGMQGEIWARPFGYPDPLDYPSLLDYPNDLVAAMELWEQVSSPKEIWWEDDEGPTIVNVYYGPIDELGFAYCLSGKPEELPRLLTRAFVIYRERE